MSRAQQSVEIVVGSYVIDAMTEHDLLDVVELEETCGLSLWGWDAYRAELGRAESVMLVARLNQRYAPDDRALGGFIAARLSGDELHVNNIGVRETARRCHLGSTLLETALRWGALHGAHLASLEVRAANVAAQSLYRRFGFQVVGRRKNYYRQPTDDALVMSAVLRPKA